jgi:nuclear pore complex protein Nup210
VANGQTIRVAAVGIGVSGEAFANSSSLSLRWELSSCEGLAYWWADAYELQRLKSSWERFLVLQNESGEVLPELAFFFFFFCISCIRFTFYMPPCFS